MLGWNHILIAADFLEKNQKNDFAKDCFQLMNDEIKGEEKREQT